jgi:hypothetical protein
MFQLPGDIQANSRRDQLVSQEREREREADKARPEVVADTCEVVLKRNKASNSTQKQGQGMGYGCGKKI